MEVEGAGEGEGGEENNEIDEHVLINEEDETFSGFTIVLVNNTDDRVLNNPVLLLNLLLLLLLLLVVLVVVIGLQRVVESRGVAMTSSSASPSMSSFQTSMSGSFSKSIL